MLVNHPQRQFERQPAPEKLCNIPRLVEVMEERGVDGIVALFGTNQYYMSSFSKHSSLPETTGSLPVIFSRHDPEHPILVMSESELMRLQVQPTWIKDIRPFASSNLPFHREANFEELARFAGQEVLENSTWGRQGAATYYSNMGQAIVAGLRDLGLTRGRVAFDNYEMGVLFASAIPELEAVPGENLFRHVRARKTDVEIELLRKASWINQTSLEGAVRNWQKGMSWHDLIFEYQINALTHGGSPNLPDTNAPDNGLSPYFHADLEVEDFELREGMNIMFDLHGRYNGYCWDGGKSWTVGGNPNPVTEKNWEATVAATREMANASRTGTKISELSRIGFETFAKFGHDEKGLIIFFHSLGLDHIDQDLSHGMKDWALQRDMVYSIHIAFPGDENQRLFIEDILHVKDDCSDRIFTWDDQLLS